MVNGCVHVAVRLHPRSEWSSKAGGSTAPPAGAARWHMRERRLRPVEVPDQVCNTYLADIFSHWARWLKDTALGRKQLPAWRGTTRSICACCIEIAAGAVPMVFTQAIRLASRPVCPTTGKRWEPFPLPHARKRGNDLATASLPIRSRAAGR